MLRVAKRLAIIVVPTGNLAQKQDRQLQKHWIRIFNNKNQFLEEHVKNGLPASDEVLVSIDQSLRKLGKAAKISSSKNLNLFLMFLLLLIIILL